MKTFFDVVFTFETPFRTETRYFKNVSAEMFYHLRSHFFKIYRNNMLSVDVYKTGTNRRLKAFCWFYEEEYDLRADLWEHDGI